MAAKRKKPHPHEIDEEHEAVLAAVVGEGELLNAVVVVAVVVSWPGS